jgi:hypothetical protein
MKKTKRLLALVLVLCMMLSVGMVSALAATYSDTEGHWAESSIERWTSYGIIIGYEDGSFGPDANITRAEAAAIFSRLLKLETKADISAFTDVEEGAWYADYVAKCVEQGILKGTSESTVAPDACITRQDFFVMFVRALAIAEESATDKHFSDEDSISPYAVGSINALLNAGIINGVAEDILAPTAYITRGSVIVLLDRAIAAYVDVDGASVTVSRPGFVVVVADDVTVKAEADVTIIDAKKDGDLSLKDSTGNVKVVAIADGVTVTDAPVGTVVAAPDAEGVTVNGKEVPEDGSVIVAAETTPYTPGPITPVTPPPTPVTHTSVIFKAISPNGGSREHDMTADTRINLLPSEVTFKSGTLNVSLNGNKNTINIAAVDDGAGKLIVTADGSANDPTNWNSKWNYVKYTHDSTVGSALTYKFTKAQLKVDDGNALRNAQDVYIDVTNDMYTAAEIAAFKVVINVRTGDFVEYRGRRVDALKDATITITGPWTAELIKMGVGLGNALLAKDKVTAVNYGKKIMNALDGLTFDVDIVSP